MGALFSLVKSFCCFILLCIYLFSGIGIIHQFFASRADKKKLFTPGVSRGGDGQFYDIGSGVNRHMLYMRETRPTTSVASGSNNSNPITIVYVGGLGMSAVVPSMAVCQEIANAYPQCRVVSFDKSGLGFSDAAPSSSEFYVRTCTAMADELHALLLAAGYTSSSANAKSPSVSDYGTSNGNSSTSTSNSTNNSSGGLILLGCSLGGMVAQMYAYRYPEDVRGLVFLDPLTKDVVDTAPPKMKTGLKVAPVVYKIGEFLSYLGLFRFLFAFSMMPAEMGDLMRDSPEYGVYLRAEMCLSRTIRSMGDEFSALPASCLQLQAAYQSRPKLDIPVALISAKSQAGLNDEEATEMVRVKHFANARIADRYLHIISENDSHTTIVQRNDLILECLQFVMSHLSQ